MIEYDLIMMTLVIFIPAIVGLSCLLIPSKYKELIRWWALIGSAATLCLSLCLLVEYYFLMDSRSDRGLRSMHHPKTLLDARADEAMRRASMPAPEPRQGYDWVGTVPWIERFDINYSIGIDGISLPLIILTSIVIFFAVIASWKIDTNVNVYFFLLLTLQTGVLGTFFAMDLFLMYVFYEVMLIPMYFLIGLWGGARRKYAAYKFVIYTLFGSVCILIAMVGLYFVDVRDFVDKNAVTARSELRRDESAKLSRDEIRDYHTFHIPTLQRAGQAAMLIMNGQKDRLTARDEPAEGKIDLLGRGVRIEQMRQRLDQPFFTPTFQYVFFALLFIGFAVKVPLVPLHSWLPDAHVEAPTPISMVLAGILLKLGGYGIIRLAYPIFPWAADQLSLVIASLGAFAIIYGALVALGQTDFKRLLAYSSISHMGYVILGIAVWGSGMKSQYWAWGMNGAMFQMVAHGITATAMFFVVGVLYDRAHTREIRELGGVMTSMPFYTGLSAILFFASMGLPGLCGFVGELFVVLGSWSYHPGLSLAAIGATVITAAYLLWTWQRVYLGVNRHGHYSEISLREAIVLLSFVVLSIALGVIPQTVLLSWMEPSVTGLVESLARLKTD